jgi:hypothetical protein
MTSVSIDLLARILDRLRLRRNDTRSYAWRGNDDQNRKIPRRHVDLVAADVLTEKAHSLTQLKFAPDLPIDVDKYRGGANEPSNKALDSSGFRLRGREQVLPIDRHRRKGRPAAAKELVHATGVHAG